jgi:pimeloyl-ACP methyl ester carboxylesterase
MKKAVAALIGVVLFHGIFSSNKTWAPFSRLLAEDTALAGIDVRYFDYPSPRFRVNPLRRIPNLNDIADSLSTFLTIEAEHYSRIVLVTHSQGGLVVQRFLARMLASGRGRELARIREIVMFACPNSGSEFVLSLRRTVGKWWRHPQERELGPLNAAVAEAHEAVLNRIVHAREVSAHECPIPIHVYSGDIDNIVTPTSARSVFPRAGVLPGDHFSVIRPDGAGHRSYAALKRHIKAVLETSPGAAGSLAPVSSTPEDGRCSSVGNVPLALGIRKSGWPRQAIVDVVCSAIESNDPLVVLYGLPRVGKTSVLCDAIGGEVAERPTLVLDASRVTPDDATRTIGQVRDTVRRSGRCLVVLDDMLRFSGHLSARRPACSSAVKKGATHERHS